MSRTETLAILAGATTGVMVGAGMVATRFVIAQTDPASLALLRYGIGTLGLVAPLLLIRRVAFERRDLLPMALLGIGQFGILIALLNFGLRFIGSGLGALLFATFPLLTMLLATALRLEAPGIAKIAGVLLTTAGVGLAVSDNLALPHAGAGNLLGMAAVLASALMGALCSVFYRPYLEKYPPLQVSIFAMLASVLFLLLPAGAEGFFAAPPDFTLGAAFLGEPGSLLFLAGLAAVIAGLWLAHLPSPR